MSVLNSTIKVLDIDYMLEAICKYLDIGISELMKPNGSEDSAEPVISELTPSTG